MKGKRAFSPEFKCEAVSLVVDRGYSITQACEAMGGATPVVGKAITPEQLRIQALEAQIRKIEREKNILKEATALLMSESFTRSKRAGY